MMKTFLSGLALWGIFVFANAQTGIGLRIGEPYGLTLKSFFNENAAIDITVGGNHFFRTVTRQTDGLDYGGPTVLVSLMAQGDVMRGSDIDIYGGGSLCYKLVKYTGGGSAITGTLTEHRVYIGAVLGFEYLPSRSSLGLFIEVNPLLELTPGLFGFAADAAVGFRAYFN